MVRLINMVGKLPGFKKRTYPITVTIFKPRGSQDKKDKKLQKVMDRARRVKFIEGGKGKRLKTWQLNLLYDGFDLPLPDNDFFMTDHKGKEYLTLYNPRYGVYLPVKTEISADTDAIKLILSKEGRTPWLMATQKKNAQDINVSAGWDKYLPVITIGIFGVIIVVSMIFYAQGLERQMGLMTQISGALERVAEKMVGIAPP